MNIKTYNINAQSVNGKWTETLSRLKWNLNPLSRPVTVWTITELGSLSLFDLPTTIYLYMNYRPWHSGWPFACMFTVGRAKWKQQHQLVLKSRFGFHFLVTRSSHELICEPVGLIYTGCQDQRMGLQLLPKQQNSLLTLELFL